MKFEHRITLTFCYLNPEGTLHHYEYARIFGIVRELFGLHVIPKFKEEVGRRYLLATKNAFYDYKAPFFFGDTVLVRMWVSKVETDRFVLNAEFINEKTGKIHATAYQTIVFTDLKGIPQEIPTEIKSAWESLK